MKDSQRVAKQEPVCNFSTGLTVHYETRKSAGAGTRLASGRFRMNGKAADFAPLTSVFNFVIDKPLDLLEPPMPHLVKPKKANRQA